MEKESTPKDSIGLHIPDNHSLIESLEQQKKEQAVLLELSSTIAGAKSRQDLRTVVTDQFPGLFGGQYYTLCLINEDGLTHSPFLHSEEASIPAHRGETPIITSLHPIKDGIFDTALSSEEPLLVDLYVAMKGNTVPRYVYRWFNAGVREMLLVKISGGGTPIGVLYLYGERRGSFQREKFRLFKGIANMLGAGFCNILFSEKIEQQLREIRKYKGQPEEASLNSPEQKRDNSTKSVIGSSAGIQKVLTVAERVAPSDSTVLLLGETGTGKEVIASAIHAASPRRNNKMVKINCAALPHSLFESELFGHEKGSFTGAMQRRIGKFEQAENSTLFLDEIGEIPLEFQAKLLRVLQEKEIERIGGKGTIKLNVRIIAATNRNLEEEVKAGNFRHDLYYRLNVIPISVPPLRERKEDIPALVTHFLRHYATINRKKTPVVPDKVMESLLHYDWPGNVRELEHLLERSILLSKGDSLQVDLPGNIHKRYLREEGNAFNILPLETMERDYILKVVRLCNGRIAGPNGAAAKLRLPSTTLNSRMQRLGIKKEHFSNRESFQSADII
jgi:formate hydrogenlyase transcriptional activator